MTINSPQPKELQKIAVFGLGNAGKTSLVKVLLHEFESFGTLLPTKGVDRTQIPFFGREIYIWDFGGQERYQEQYLNRAFAYFENIKYLFYVVDVQDIEKMQENIQYFEEILRNMIEYSPDAKLYLFFHKFDPHYKGPVDLLAATDEFLAAITPMLNAHNIDPVYFQTSIHNPLSIIAAFSQPLLGNDVIYDSLCQVIAAFCIKYELDFGFIFLHQFELGSYYMSPGTFKDVNKRIADYLQELDLEMDVPPYEIGYSTIHTIPFVTNVDDKTYRFYFAIGVDTIDPPANLDEILSEMKYYTENLKKILVNAELIRKGQGRIEDLMEGVVLPLEAPEVEDEAKEGFTIDDGLAEKKRQQELDRLNEEYGDAIDKGDDEDETSEADEGALDNLDDDVIDLESVDSHDSKEEE